MRQLFAIVAVLLIAIGLRQAQAVDDFAQAKTDFESNCASCHGSGGAGGDRAPALSDNPELRRLDESAIASLIHNGLPGGMPAFVNLPRAKIDSIAAWIHSMNRSALRAASQEDIEAGMAYFFGPGGCSACHMVRGHGGSNGPDLSAIAVNSNSKDLVEWLNHPNAMVGTKSLPSCPSWAFCPDFEWAVSDLVLNDGQSLRGFMRAQTEHDLVFQTLDGAFHLVSAAGFRSLKREDQSLMPTLKASARERADLLAYLSSLDGIKEGPIEGATSAIAQNDIDALTGTLGDWPTYNGSFDANRWSPLDQINIENVKDLQPQFVFSPGGQGLEGTPLEYRGILYLTGGTRVCAISARTGTRIWCSLRTNGLAQTARKSTLPTGPNRGLALLGNRLFYISDDAYLVCLNRITGAVMWSVWLPEKNAKGKFYSSMAPLIVNNMVIAGIAGGDSPMRGFLAAYYPDTGKLAWRFYTIPEPGTPLAASWKGTALPTGGGATWSTGSYDRETDTLFWAVGNPYPDTDAGEREGRNLYTNSVLALDPERGRLKWYYQFTPFDTHDWDATEPLVLADTQWNGKPRKLLMSAQRSGVFYVLDRTNGKFLLAKPFVKRLTWAQGFNSDGTPIFAPGNTPTVQGTKTCPGVRGATNWYAQAFDPKTRLYYVMAAEDCGIYRKSGKIFGNNPDPLHPGLRYLRALNIETGDIIWEKPLVGPQETNYSGVLATAGGLVFHGETGGSFAAVDAKTGKTLWSFPANDSWRASPMTYMVGNRQFVAGMAGTNLLSFALGKPN